MNFDANSHHRQFQNPSTPLTAETECRQVLNLTHRRSAYWLAAVLVLLLTSAYIRPLIGKRNDFSCSRYIAITSQALPGGLNGNRAPVRAFCKNDVCLPVTSSTARFSLGMMRVLQVPIPINDLNREDWESLSGIGPKIAEKIMEARYNKGGFRSLDDLSAVPGIGPARMMVLQAAINGVNRCPQGQVACQ